MVSVKMQLTHITIAISLAAATVAGNPFKLPNIESPPNYPNHNTPTSTLTRIASTHIMSHLP